jgi:hypothetical protein
VIEHLPIIYKALGPIPSTIKKKKEKEKEKRNATYFF